MRHYLSHCLRYPNLCRASIAKHSIGHKNAAFQLYPCGCAIPAPSTFGTIHTRAHGAPVQCRALSSGGNLAALPLRRPCGVFFGRLRYVLHTNYFIGTFAGFLRSNRPPWSAGCHATGPDFAPWSALRFGVRPGWRGRGRSCLMMFGGRACCGGRPAAKWEKKRAARIAAKLGNGANASRRSRFGNWCGYFAPQPPTKTKFCGWPVKHSKARFGVPYAYYQAPRIAYNTGFQPFAGVCPGVPRYTVARCPYVAAARLAPFRVV